MYKFISEYYIIIILISIFSCKGEVNEINPGDDPNFTIISHSDQGFSTTNRKVSVFGIDIYAVPEVNDSKLLHAANVLAQYLDNNEDEIVDNTEVHNKMLENKAFVIMWKDNTDLDINPPDNRIGQDLGDDETNPSFVINNKQGQFDASLEEIWHIISHSGYAYAYPGVFGLIQKGIKSSLFESNKEIFDQILSEKRNKRIISFSRKNKFNRL